MASLKCAMCGGDTELICCICKSASYCSVSCQQKDAPLHKLLCDRFESFLASNPRPADTFKSTYKLAILFPETKKLLELIWIETRLTYKEEEDKWEYDCNFDQYIEGGAVELDAEETVKWPLKIAYGPKIRQHNACLGFLIRGSGKLGSPGDDADQILSEYRGGIVTVGTLKTNAKKDHKERYRDITMNDLRHSLTFFCEWIYAHYSTDLSPFVVLDKPTWIKGVTIGSVYTMSLGCGKYVSELVQHDTKPFQNIKTFTSPILTHLGFPLSIITENSSLDWSLLEKDLRDDENSNEEGTMLLKGTNPSSDHSSWWNRTCLPGCNNSPTNFNIGTVTVYRNDHKDISEHHVEALVSYCKNVLQVAMKDESGVYDEHDKQAIIDTYITLAKFCEYFESFKKNKFSKETAYRRRAKPGEACKALELYQITVG
ncbi:uncharacterized protein LY89DRAFT_725113 [Mollisia scopiformis]|uniref:MYND-type domain-containing protein n=1 Tax=Mollisia scopiformis TaxID=149040 RepID=A0A132B6Z8_MOLSC|nr:uncharacterized protein LY89DRAFT_725113 [Mollisia scopiformis]KUJ08180.1 hypothetical protein LY89DRAFT_725113 [Mollisia scopiformis]